MKKSSLISSCFVAFGALTGCGSSNDQAPAAVTLGVVAGAADAHCAAKTVNVDPAACKAPAPAADAGDADGGTAMSDYGATLSLTEGDDDDCKYHVKWSPAANASFNVVLTKKADGSPVTGAPIDIEAFLDETHPAPNTTRTTKETSPGTYTVGPVAFDTSGRWTVRFHIHDECNDGETSPHGHAAFYVQVTRP